MKLLRRIIPVVAMTAITGFSSDILADNGIRATSDTTGVIYFDVKPTWVTDGWNYVCLGTNCLPGTLVEDKIERPVTGLSLNTSYQIQIKIQDSASGQDITPYETVLFEKIDNPTPEINLQSIFSLEPPVPGNTVSYVAQVISNGAVIDKVDFYLTEPGGIETLITSDSSEPFEVSTQVNTLGIYNVRAEISDDTGVIAEDSDTFTVIEFKEFSYSVTVPPSLKERDSFSGEVIIQEGSHSFLRSVNLVLTAPDTTKSSWVYGSDQPAFSFDVTDALAGTYMLDYDMVVITGDSTETISDQYSFTVAENPNALPVISLGPVTVDNNDVLTVEASASDSDGTITVVDFYATGPATGNIEERIVSKSNTPYLMIFPNVTPGDYFIRAVATDNDGETAQATTTYRVEADNLAPSISLITDDAVHYAGENVSVFADARDSDGTVSYVEFTVRPPNDLGTNPVFRDSAEPFEYTISNGLEGTYEISAVAVDNDGDFTADQTTVTFEPAIVTRELKLEAESGVINSPARIYPDEAASGGEGVAYIFQPGAGFLFNDIPASSRITLTYASALSGTISVKVNGVSQKVNFNSTGGWVSSYQDVSQTINIPDGSTVEILFEAGDSAINVDYVTFEKIVDDNTAPEVSVSVPDQILMGDDFTIFAEATDADGFVEQVEFIVSDGDGSIVYSDFDTEAPFEVTINAWQTGLWNVIAKAYDDDGSSSEDVLGFEVTGLDDGLLDPVISLSTDSNIEAPNPISVSVEELTTPIVSVKFFVTPPGQSEIELGTDTEAPFSWQILETVPGEYIWAAIATSQDGRNSNRETITTVVESGLISQPAQEINIGPGPNGDILVGGDGHGEKWLGMTVYTFDDDIGSGGSVCNGRCAEVWPPVLAVDGLASGPVGLNGIGQITRDDQKEQITFNGRPLYFYSEDQNPGDISGNARPGWFYVELNSNETILAPSLPAPINGLTAPDFGFAFDIDGRNLEVRTGAPFVQQTNDWISDTVGFSDTPFHPWEFWCSNDQIKFFGTTLTTDSQLQHSGTIPSECVGSYYFYFKYFMESPVNSDPNSNTVYTALFHIDENDPASRVDPRVRAEIKDTTSDWFRFRQPGATDGTHLAIFDASHNNTRLDQLDRFSVHTIDKPGFISFEFDVLLTADNPGGIARFQLLEFATDPDLVNTYVVSNPCDGLTCAFENRFSYGQVLRMEMLISSPLASFQQIYTTHINYVVGQGYYSPVSDPRLTMAGKAGTHIVLKRGPAEDLEADAIFTQHMTSLLDKNQIDTFLKGHHLIHGVDPDAVGSFDLDVIKIGERTCGDCHFRDGRGSDIFATADGDVRLPPPLLGVGMLEFMEGRSTGFGWKGTSATVEDQVKAALKQDHKVEPSSLPQEDLRLLVEYTEMVTVPARTPGIYKDPDIVRGDELFTQTGCVDCHTPVQKTVPNAPAGYQNLILRPYTDMKLHKVNGEEFKTPALWGLGRNIELLERNNRAVIFLHDGSTASLHDVISSKHTDDAQDSSDAYNDLNTQDQNALIKFLQTL